MNKRGIICVVVLLLGIFQGAALAESYYVAADGSDSNDGRSLSNPFLTIQKAADTVTAGDTVYIRQGRYKEAVYMADTSGSSGNQIVFTNYQNEAVVIDGTEDISDLAVNSWTQHSGDIYKITLGGGDDPNVWQLFVDGEMMTNARWPNARFDNGTNWMRHKYWGTQSSALSTFGKLYDLPHHDVDMAGSNLDFDGAMAIMNTGVFRTYGRQITDHTAGEGHFHYAQTFNTDWDAAKWANKNKDNKSRYFIEDKLNLLDVEYEWFFDKDTKILYLYKPGGGSPASSTVLGKVRSYGMEFYGCDYVTVQGIDFFGCTLIMARSGVTYNEPSDCVVEDCDFDYPTYSRRMLGVQSEMNDSITPPFFRVNAKNSPDANHTLRNLTFRHTDGRAFDNYVPNSLIENILIEDADWTNVGGLVFRAHKCDGALIRQVSMREVGSPDPGQSEWNVENGEPAITWELIDISRVGYAGYDGCSVESWCDIGRYSWMHNHPKYSFRFDGTHSYSLSHHNVSWMTGPSKLKGDIHQVYNHTACRSSGSELVIYQSEGNTTSNINTITRNNAAEIISDKTGAPLNGPPGTVSNNWEGDLSAQLRDWRNLDFRPKAGSALIDAGMVIPGITDGYFGSAPDIGAYEYGDTNYWIPGFQYAHSSRPIPPDGATKVKLDADLMWLEGYKSSSHRVYFGTDETAVTDATVDSDEYQGSQNNNIFTPPSGLTENTEYFWRVDAVGGPKGTVKGETWSFIAEGPFTETVFVVAEDTCTNRSNKNTNFGLSEVLSTTLFGHYVFGKEGSVAYLKFNVTAVTGTVVGARVKVRIRGEAGYGLGAHMLFERYLFGEDEAWDENTMTWNNRPIVYPSPVDAINYVYPNTYYTLDVGDIVKGNGTYTIAVLTTGGDEISFFSKEYKDGLHAPSLTVESIGGTPPDTTPPADPNLLAVVGVSSTVDLDWDDNTEDDLWGYNVYRSETSGSGYEKLNNDPVTASQYTDNTTSPSTTYYYVVTAVDFAPNESGYSNEVYATTDIASGGSVDFMATDDTYTDKNEPSLPHGSDIRLLCKLNVYDVYIKFDVSGTANIMSATLKLYAADDDNPTVDCYAVDDTGWSEENLTKDNRPAMGDLLDTAGPIAKDTWGYWDVTEHIIDNGSFALGLKSQDSTYFKFNSKEKGSAAPVLTVVYDGGAGGNPPTFDADPFSAADALQGSPYSASLVDDVSEVDGDSLTFSKVSGPFWLMVAPNGEMSGVPDNDDVGANAFTVKVQDNDGSDEATMNITVINVNDPPEWINDDPYLGGPPAYVDYAYSGDLSNHAEDPDLGDSLTFTKLSGAAWLLIASDGTMSGTPGAGDIGTDQFNVKVEDQLGLSDIAAVHINISIFVTNPDITGGGVDFADFEIVARHWLESCTGPDWCEGADINHINGVNIDDLQILASEWLD